MRAFQYQLSERFLISPLTRETKGIHEHLSCGENAVWSLPVFDMQHSKFSTRHKSLGSWDSFVLIHAHKATCNGFSRCFQDSLDMLSCVLPAM